MKKLALLLSLLALGALGLVACGGGDDDDAATAATETETTHDELAADNKSCGAFGRDHDPPWRLAVVEGDISCRVTRRVMHDWADNRLPGSWSCTGPEANVVCTKKPGASSRIVITAHFDLEAASPPPTPAGGPTEDPPVARHTVTEQGVSFSFGVPVGHLDPGDEGWWERHSSLTTDKSARGPISINKSMSGPQDAEAIIFWTSFPDGDYADPCAGLLSLPVGSSAADLAAAVSTAPGTELLTGPSNVTLGGRPAKHVALTVRENVGCNPGFFYTWRAGIGGANWLKTGVGDTIRVWIVDVHGTRLFIEAETTKGYGFGLEREVQQIVESIRFE
jgi:hypothetical protein